MKRSSNLQCQSLIEKQLCERITSSSFKQPYSRKLLALFPDLSESRKIFRNTKDKKFLWHKNFAIFQLRYGIRKIKCCQKYYFSSTAKLKYYAVSCHYRIKILHCFIVITELKYYTVSLSLQNYNPKLLGTPEEDQFTNQKQNFWCFDILWISGV